MKWLWSWYFSLWCYWFNSIECSILILFFFLKNCHSSLMLKKQSLWNIALHPLTPVRPLQPLESQTFVLLIQRKSREGIHGHVGEPNWLVLLAVSAGVKMAFQHFQNVCVRDVDAVFIAGLHQIWRNTDLEITADPLESEWVPDSICLTKALSR